MKRILGYLMKRAAEEFLRLGPLGKLRGFDPANRRGFMEWMNCLRKKKRPAHHRSCMELVNVKNFLIGPNQPLAVMCGPCVMESEEHTFAAAEELKELFSAFPFSFIFKASYEKANRSWSHSFRGPGIEKGAYILQRIQNELDLPVITDVHSPKRRLWPAMCAT